MARFGGIVKKFLGPDSIARQFFVWQIMAEVISTAMTPFITALSNEVNSKLPLVPLSPESLADMVNRGIVERQYAQGEAAKTGIHRLDFDFLVERAGSAPAIGDMLLLWRQGKIDRARMVRAIRQAGLKEEWTDEVLLLGIQPPTPEAILDALLQGQTDEATAQALYRKLGGDPDYFTLLYNTRGTAPTPVQAADMAVRGIIPWDGRGPDAVSFEQAFLEGPWRNKWIESFRKSAEYIPPPDTIVEMLRVGALEQDAATALLLKNGVPNELIGAFLAKASGDKTVKVKELTESHIQVLYRDQAINEATALEMLGKLRYAESEARFVLRTWKLARELAFRNQAISTVRTQFLAHRIGNEQASTLLDEFQVPADQRDALIRLWIQEERARVAILTPAQVRTAFKKDLFPVEEAVRRLLDQGYNEEDAAIFLQL